ncbi:hypothetical protein DIPPA_10006 [Diplonema papillatum]|nr:hypothetical protein DIPPA_10006 [Diplonema papillatum]
MSAAGVEDGADDSSDSRFVYLDLARGSTKELQQALELLSQALAGRLYAYENLEEKVTAVNNRLGGGV